MKSAFLNERFHAILLIQDFFSSPFISISKQKGLVLDLDYFLSRKALLKTFFRCLTKLMRAWPSLA